MSDKLHYLGKVDQPQRGQLGLAAAVLTLALWGTWFSMEHLKPRFGWAPLTAFMMIGFMAGALMAAIDLDSPRGRWFLSATTLLGCILSFATLTASIPFHLIS